VEDLTLRRPAGPSRRVGIGTVRVPHASRRALRALLSMR
jgi:hypothetical protein